MLLLLSISRDGTSDRLCQHLGERVFRYNIDQILEYHLCFSPGRWEIINPAGRKISSLNASYVFFWKAFSVIFPEVDSMVFAESKYIFRELYSWFPPSGVKGNHPNFHETYGKIKILNLAKEFFTIPNSVFTYKLHGENVVDRNSRVVKSLSSILTSEGKSLFTTDVSNRNLDPEFPWFIQSKIDASHDVTCLLVGTRIFTFSRSRANLLGLDWRAEQVISPTAEEWNHYDLPKKYAEKILLLSKKLNVSWGRYDFMLSKAGVLISTET